MGGSWRSRVAVLGLATYGGLAVVILLLWLPVIVHFYVPKPQIADDIVHAARSSPSDTLLRELGGFRFFGGTFGTSVVTAADKLLQGVFEERPGQDPIRITIPFDPADLEREGFQLFLASFGVPQIFLEAYAASGREDFLDAARSVVMSWLRFEEGAWLPTGLSWNDHAVAERVLVLAEFWRVYRQHVNYEPAVGRAVIELAARHGVLLSSPSHFTVATNHGVMQNLALLHLCLAFPTLPNVEEYKRLALERLDDQLRFYINDEGVVLEHSPGYHKAGLEFLSKALRYLTLLDVVPPATWLEKYRRAKDFYAEVRLPDGRLPLFGDTKLKRDALGPLLADVDADGRTLKLEYQKRWVPSGAVRIDPVAGYAIWWSGLAEWPREEALAQTMVSWSYFPGHSHKHADELSLWMWAAGHAWLRNVGYWPYDRGDRAQATSWSGSNAPHLVGERGDSPRQSVLRAFASSDELAYIHLQRTGPGEYSASRQMLWRKPAFWLVLDLVAAEAGKTRTRTIWTTSPDVRIEAGPIAGSFSLHGQRKVLDALFSAPPTATITSLKGSSSPFAGWAMAGVGVSAAPAIVVEQPAADAWAVAAWSLRGETELPTHITRTPRLVRTENDSNWTVSVSTRTADLIVERHGDTIAVLQDSGSTKTRAEALVQVPSGDSEAYDSIRRSHLAAMAKYPQFKDHYRYRAKLSWLLVGAFVVQESLLAYLKGRDPRRHAVARLFTFCCWIVGGGLLLTSYLPVAVELYTRFSPFRLE